MINYQHKLLLEFLYPYTDKTPCFGCYIENESGDLERIVFQSEGSRKCKILGSPDFDSILKCATDGVEKAIFADEKIKNMNISYGMEVTTIIFNVETVGCGNIQFRKFVLGVPNKTVEAWSNKNFENLYKDLTDLFSMNSND